MLGSRAIQYSDKSVLPAGDQPPPHRVKTPFSSRRSCRFSTAFLAASLLATPLLPLLILDQALAGVVPITINSSVTKSVYGNSINPDGYDHDGDPNGNELDIYANVNGDAYGAMRSTGGEDVRNNTVIIDKNATVSGDVYGGFSNGGGATTDNRVIIRPGVTVVGSVYGGHTTGGGASGNTIEIDGGKVNGNVFGGSTTGGGHLGDSIITINDGTIGGSVYAGGETNGNGSVDNNQVTISGKTNITGDLRGGTTTGNKGDASSNTLNVKGKDLRVGGDLNNFNKLNFYLPSDLNAEGTALYVGGTATVTGATVDAGFIGGMPLKPGDKVYLINSNNLVTGDIANQHRNAAQHWLA